MILIAAIVMIGLVVAAVCMSIFCIGVVLEVRDAFPIDEDEDDLRNSNPWTQ